MAEKNKPPLQAFGFSIPIIPAGRRVWSPKFKRFILGKMSSGELTLDQIVDTCGISKFYVYQWRMQAQGEPVTAAEWRAKAQFAEIVVQQDEKPTVAGALLPAQIKISGLITEITLPYDYPSTISFRSFGL